MDSFRIVQIHKECKAQISLLLRHSCRRRTWASFYALQQGSLLATCGACVCTDGLVHASAGRSHCDKVHPRKFKNTSWKSVLARMRLPRPTQSRGGLDRADARPFPPVRGPLRRDEVVSSGSSPRYRLTKWKQVVTSTDR